MSNFNFGYFGCPANKCGGFKYNDSGMPNANFSHMGRYADNCQDTWTPPLNREGGRRGGMGRVPEQPEHFKCRGPQFGISNIYMNHGFGTYRSETQDQFPERDPRAGLVNVNRSCGLGTYRNKIKEQYGLPCKIPRISNVHCDHAFGAYRSQPQERFDPPFPQGYGDCIYELPSGFSTRNGDGLWDPYPATCKEDRERYRVTTPPQRHDPWPMINLSHAQFLDKGYRPGPDDKRIDYRLGTVLGTTSFEPHTVIY